VMGILSRLFGQAPTVHQAPLAVAGAVGIEHGGGQITEEWESRLRGTKGAKEFREMTDTDAVIGGVQSVIEGMMGAATPKFSPPPGKEQDAKALWIAERLEEMRGDMESTWHTIFSEMMQAHIYGSEVLEVTFKIRRGASPVPWLKSQYHDGIWAWRDWSPRPRLTIDRWDIDDDGVTHGFWQRPPPSYLERYVPMSRCMLIKFRGAANNPEGRSTYRNCWRAWRRIKRQEDYEIIGNERHVSGMPHMQVPPHMLSSGASAAEVTALNDFKNLVAKIRQDRYLGLVSPAEYDAAGNRSGYAFRFENSGSSNTSSTDISIKRDQSRLLIAVLCELLILGQDKVGSHALADNHTSMLALQLERWLCAIDDEINRVAVPVVMELNGWDSTLTPVHGHGQIEDLDLGAWAQALNQLVQAGAVVVDNSVQEEARRRMSLPARDLTPADGGGL
jgi:hypothetical protein